MIDGITTTSIDVSTIVDSLIENASAPLNTYEANLEEKEDKLTALELIQGRLSSLRETLSSLSTVSSNSVFGEKEATSSNESAVTASASSDASTGTYDITVNQLARAHKVASSQWTSGSTDIVTAEGAGTKTFTITVNGVDTEISVDVSDGDDNETILRNIAEAISSSSADAEAVVVSESGTTARLIITSGSTGTEGEITLQDTSGTLLLNSGVIDGTGAVANELVAAQDAEFVIDSLTFTRSSNTVDDVISGVTVTLNSTGTSTLKVGLDTDAAKAAIEAFVTDYNDAITGIKSQTEYDTEENTSSPLTGDSVIKRMTKELRRLATAEVSTQDAAYNTLYKIGIEIDENGEMEITDSDKLLAALQNDPDAVASLFNTADTGVASRMEDYLDEALETGGKVASRIETVNKNIEKLEKKITSYEDYLAKLEERLLLRWAKVEAAISANDSLSEYLSNAFSSNDD